nr:MAG: DNA methyltransferase [uncultured archaeon]
MNKQDIINKIIFGDCLDILPEVPNNCFDLIIIDLPYNISQKRVFTRKECKDLSLNFGDWDFFSDDQFIAFLFSLLENCNRLLKDSGTLYIFIPDKYLSYARFYCEEKLNMFYKTTIVRYKPNPPPRFLKKSFCFSTEFCICVQKEKEKSIFNFLGQNKMHNLFKHPIVSGKERLDHPTQKPEKLIKWFIEISSNENDLVGDFFLGSGTTSVVAKKLRRKYFGIEIEPKYYEIARNRIESINVYQNITNFTKKPKQKELTQFI